MAVAGATASLNGDTTTDLNGDNIPDIVIANPGVNNVNNIDNYNNVIVLLGNGDGTFKAPVIKAPVYPVDTDPVSVALGDFKYKGDPPDIITANEAGNSVSVLLNNGDGTFQPREDIPITVPPFPMGDTVDKAVSNPSSVAVGDFNGDGNLDFVTANASCASVNVVLGNGDGSFGVQQTIDTLTYSSYPTDPNAPDPPTSVVAADLDGDGFTDIAFTEPNHDSIGLLSGNGNGTFATRVDHVAGEASSVLVAGNLNGDQTSLGNDRLDLVAVATNDTRVSVLLGQKYTTTTTLDPNLSTITYGDSVGVTPIVNPGYSSQQMPLIGAFQLVLDGVDYGVPQPLGSTFVLTGLRAGRHTLGAWYLGDADHQPSTSTSTVRRCPRQAHRDRLDQSRTYGAAEPTFTYSITGFVNGDFLDQSLPSGEPSFTATDSGPSSPVGTYRIYVFGRRTDPRSHEAP